MKFRRWNDIVAIDDGKHRWGFHARNLQVAQIDQEIWNALHPLEPRSETTAPAPEAQAEIQAWNHEQDPEVSDLRLGLKVRSLTINVTQICNLRCTYCAAGGDGTYGSSKGKVDLSSVFVQLEKYIPALKTGEDFNITFFGGEPLLHPEAIREIAQKARELANLHGVQLRFAIITNGTLLSESHVRLLADLRADVTLSIDGPPEINDQTRPSAGGRGVTERVLDGLSRLAQARQELRGITVNAVFGDHNLEVFKAWEFFRTLPFDNFNLIYASNPKDDDKNSQIFINEITRIAEAAFTFGGLRELRRITLFEQLISTLENRQRLLNHCGAGKTLLFSDTQGQNYACNWFTGQEKELLGNSGNLVAERRAEYADPLIDKHGCQSCWARFLCGGGCMFVNQSKTGDKNRKDSTFCFRQRSLSALAIRYFGQEHTIGRDSYETH